MAKPTPEEILDIFDKCNQLERLGVDELALDPIRRWAARAGLAIDWNDRDGVRAQYGITGESGRSLSAMDARDELDSYAQRMIEDSQRDREA